MKLAGNKISENVLIFKEKYLYFHGFQPELSTGLWF